MFSAQAYRPEGMHEADASYNHPLDVQQSEGVELSLAGPAGPAPASHTREGRSEGGIGTGEWTKENGSLRYVPCLTNLGPQVEPTLTQARGNPITQWETNSRVQTGRTLGRDHLRRHRDTQVKKKNKKKKGTLVCSTHTLTHSQMASDKFRKTSTRSPLFPVHLSQQLPVRLLRDQHLKVR